MLTPGVNAQTPPESLKSCSPETVTREALVDVINGLSPVLGAERRIRTWKGGIRNSHTQERGGGGDSTLERLLSPLLLGCL